MKQSTTVRVPVRLDLPDWMKGFPTEVKKKVIECSKRANSENLRCRETGEAGKYVVCSSEGGHAYYVSTERQT